MKTGSKFVVLALICILSIGFMSGCAELEELQIANRRQAITIRDQLHEIELLDGRIKSYGTLNKERLVPVQSETDRHIFAELEKLAKSIGEDVSVNKLQEGAVLLLSESLLFDSETTVLRRAGDHALREIADHLREKHSLSMRIDVHAIIAPVIDNRLDWDLSHHLSAGRALSIFDYLAKKEGINPQRMHVAVHGSPKQGSVNSAVIEDQKNTIGFLFFQ